MASLRRQLRLAPAVASVCPPTVSFHFSPTVAPALDRKVSAPPDKRCGTPGGSGADAAACAWLRQRRLLLAFPLSRLGCRASSHISFKGFPGPLMPTVAKHLWSRSAVRKARFPALPAVAPPAVLRAARHWQDNLCACHRAPAVWPGAVQDTGAGAECFGRARHRGGGSGACGARNGRGDSAQPAAPRTCLGDPALVMPAGRPSTVP